MRAAIYLRVSTDRQVEEGFSMEAQHDLLMDVLNKKSLQLYRVYSDPGISGGSFKRPGIQLMISDMKAGKFDTILVHKLDRLSRNQGDLYGFIGMINKLNVRLIIAAQGSEEIDTRSPMGKAFLSISGIWAELYLDNLREETLKGLVKKAQKGGRHMSKPPLGYAHDNEKNLIIVESEAEVVREVYRLYLTGLGVTSISKKMHDGKYRLKEGGKWDSKSVRNIIKNPTYAGYNHFKPEHWEEDKRIIELGNHVPIISKADYEKAKGYIERRSNGQMSKRSFEYPYSGVVKCALCGGNYSGNSSVTKGKVYRSYRCINNYLRHHCDSPSVSENVLNDLLFSNIMMLDDSIQPKKEEHKKEIRDMKKEIEVSNKRRKNWMLALGDGNLSSEDYSMLIDEEDERMKGIVDELKNEVDLYEPEIPTDVLKHMIISIKDNWDIIEVETKKQLIQNMLRKIVIKKENDWKVVDLQTV